VSDFWQATGSAGGGMILNLDHVISVDRQGADLRICTVLHTMAITLVGGSAEERSFLEAMAKRIEPGNGGSRPLIQSSDAIVEHVE